MSYIATKKESHVYFVHTAQDTTRLATYGGHWRPSLQVAVVYWNSAPSVPLDSPGTVSGLTSTQSNDDR